MDASKAMRLQKLAWALAARYAIPLGEDFHALPASTVDNILKAADRVKYRKPRNANGSRGRYFYAKLNREARYEARYT